MSIQKVRYFISIVENDFNITNAAEDLHISQPALSQIIKSYENELGIELFNRRKGRLVSLTPFGHEVYKKSMKINRAYEDLENLVDNYDSDISGTVIVGVPSFLLSTIYSDVLPAIISNNPTINIIIKELSTQNVRESLEKGNIDIGILIEPTHLDQGQYSVKQLVVSDYRAYMAPSNPFAHKKQVTWKELGGASLALVQKEYISSRLIDEKFSEYDIHPNIRFSASAWDYLISICRKSDLVTILPAINMDLINKESIIEIPIVDPIIWTSVIASSHDNLMNKTIQYAYELFSEEFGLKQ